MKRWIVLLVLLSILVIGAACEDDGATTKAPADTVTAEQAANTVDLTLNARLQEGGVLIEGSTDLPDGTLLAYEVRHERFATDVDTPIEQLFAEGNMSVSGNTFSTTVDLTGWPEGSIEVWVAFQTLVAGGAVQPPDIIERFGELGENLEGSNVVEAGALKRVEVTQALQR